MANELKYFINNYLRHINQISHSGFFRVSKEELNQALHNLIKFERPDMYALVSDTLIILEHFEFDASRRTKNGMHGKKEESNLNQRTRENIEYNKWHTGQASYKISPQDWQNNFEYTFKTHYDNLDYYIQNVSSQISASPSKTLIGFLVENQFSPFVNEKNKYCGEIPYVITKQFVNFFIQHKKVDFILFIGYLGGEPHLIYLDQESVKSMPNLIDIYNDGFSFSHLNNNDIIGYCKFENTII